MKDLNYYMNLPYKIEITPIPDEKGGGFMATLPEIGRYAITGDGDTVEEALQNLAVAKKEQFEIYLEEGTIIPEPEQNNQYSGRFPLRMPKYLHRDLAMSAKYENMSLNSYIIYLISRFNELAQTRELMVSEIKQCVSILQQQIVQLDYIICKEESHVASHAVRNEFKNYIPDDFKQAA